MRKPLAIVSIFRAACAALLAVVSGSVLAQQQVCDMVKLKDPALKLDQMFKMAEERAKKWKPDVVLADLGTTTTGLLRPDGSSVAWHILYFSPSAKATVSIGTFNGMLNCHALPHPAGRIPDLAPGFLVDGAKLYAFAKEHGAKELADGYEVNIGLAANTGAYFPSDRFATWNITFMKKEDRNADLLILVDANKGVVYNVNR